MAGMAVLAIGILTGCDSRQDRCFQAASRDLAALMELTVKIERDLARGFAERGSGYTIQTVETCGAGFSEGEVCSDQTTFRESEVSPIDRAFLTEQLAVLQAQRPDVEEAARLAYMACLEAS